MPRRPSPSNAPSEGKTAEVRAVAYVRMSTEHQQYSTQNQLDVIRQYAQHRGMEVVRVYSDEGRSGLNIKDRAGINQLLTVVQGGAADFSVILVYDVSRWGRFQDADESAYYEYLCRRSGVAVHYCAEQFVNDGSLSANVLKNLKRSMAAEYSREMSSKVFQGACRLIQLGYRQGGPAGYGLRRLRVDHQGVPKELLARGERKSIQTDRVVQTLGPPEEVENVRWMYRALVEERRTEAEIAALLNARGVLTDLGRPWTRGTVHEVLTNEKYVGNNVYHRTSFRLKKRHVRNPPDMWVRADGVFEAVVGKDLFAAAQEIILARSRHYEDEEMLVSLRAILVSHGRLSGLLIDETEDAPSSAAVRHRFGSLVRAYQLIGYAPETDYRYLEVNRLLREMHPKVVAEVVERIAALGSRIELDQHTGLWRINREFTASLVLARCRPTAAGSLRWLIRLEQSLQPDITVAVRLDADNQGILDYYLLPALDISAGRLRLGECNGVYLDAYRFDNLDFFYDLTRRAQIKEAA